MKEVRAYEGSQNTINVFNAFDIFGYEFTSKKNSTRLEVIFFAIVGFVFWLKLKQVFRH